MALKVFSQLRFSNCYICWVVLLSTGCVILLLMLLVNDADCIVLKPYVV